VTTYLALLRGVNVGGRGSVRMADLRRLFVALGHADVQSYLQSGNLVFRSPLEALRLGGEIERCITQELGLKVTVLLRTADDLARIVADNPLLDRTADPTRLHLTFLAAAPEPARVARLEKPGDDPDEFALAGRELYLYCPNGYGRTRLNNAYFERRLGVPATTRSWKTVVALRDLSSG
jgi:uncharacterized protein (DUF1697 family)